MANQHFSPAGAVYAVAPVACDAVASSCTMRPSFLVSRVHRVRQGGRVHSESPAPRAQVRQRDSPARLRTRFTVLSDNPGYWRCALGSDAAPQLDHDQRPLRRDGARLWCGRDEHQRNPPRPGPVATVPPYEQWARLPVHRPAAAGLSDA